MTTKHNNSLGKNPYPLMLAGLLLFCSPLLMAEKPDHDAHEHRAETTDHDDHKGDEGKHDDHDDHKEDEGKHDDHDDRKEDEGKHDDHDDHKEDEGKHDDHDDHNENKETKDDGHGHGGGGHEEASTDVELSKQQMQSAGIKTMRLSKQSVSNSISALGEVKLNQYRTVKVSPSITTRIEKRHVRRGDTVKKGQLLVTLHTISTTDISANVLATADLAASSAELAANVAQAKGELAAATATWDRIRSLGQDAVSGKRYTEARIAKQQAAAKLAAYGKSQSQVKRLLKSGSKAVQKHFELRAEQAGMVISDDFVLGQIVNPEDVLIVISDIDHLWVEANIKPKNVQSIRTGSQATITSGGKTLPGKVVYIGRILNEKTRTLPVRIEVDTTGSSLYPGQFVKTSINSQATQAAITVPAEAVLRSADGDWMLFVEEAPGRFVPKEVEILQNRGDSMVIKGIPSGTTIVSKGAFFVQSELAKSGFSVHNH